MKTKPVSPKVHSLVDYALAGSLLVLPSAFGFNKAVKRLYMAEGIVLLTYIALTDQPAAIKPVIPFPVHGKIDPFNIAQFALQTFLNLSAMIKKQPFSILVLLLRPG